MKNGKLSLVVEGELPESLSKNNLQEVADAVADATHQKVQAVVGISFVDKVRSQELNRTYAGADYSTDVLSFNYNSIADEMGASLGDIVVCLPIARQQAKQYRTSEKTELILLMIHGLLHLLGYDHQTSEQAASLDHLQSDIMGSLKQEYRDFQWSH